MDGDKDQSKLGLAALMYKVFEVWVHAGAMLSLVVPHCYGDNVESNYRYEVSSNFIILRELSINQKSPLQIIWIFAVRMEGAPQSEFEVAFSASQVCWVDFVMYENDRFFYIFVALKQNDS